MPFAQDLFISYAHIDNQPLPPAEQGWITRFHRTLEVFLSMRMGESVSIWRDDKLEGNDRFPDEIVDRFADSAVLVSVLTPRYLKSEWCTRELREFIERAEKAGGIAIDNKFRFFKVLKTPVEDLDEGVLPAPVKEALGYRFYVLDGESPLELDPTFGEKFAQDYNRKVGKLAWEIAKLLKAIAEGAGSGDPKGTVYLAESSYDQREAREMLEGELRRHGYTILPDRRMPSDEDGYVATVQAMLDRASVAVHFVGEGRGVVPDGPSAKSVVELQNDAALLRSRSNGLPRLIWLPDHTRSGQNAHSEFIERLHCDPEAQFGADVIGGDFEVLKTTLFETLRNLDQPGCVGAERDGGAFVYLICDERDRKATVPLRKFLKGSGIDVEIPLFEGDASVVRRANEQHLSECDGVLIFYGAGDEAWKHATEKSLDRARAYRRGRPLSTTYTYIADPQTSAKEDLIHMEEPGLIIGTDGFRPSLMSEFLEAVGGTGERRA